MPSVPGSFNGGIPPNIVWDADNPPIKHSCSDGLMHAPGCDGACADGEPMKEYEVDLLNEHREWGRVGMNPAMITSTSTPFDFEARLSALSEFLVEKGVIEDIEELNEFYARLRIERMRDLRIANQEAVKRQRLGLPGKPQIFGPGGEIL
jgi:hypothetical protein